MLLGSFTLTLMMTHRCNMACSYCYMGAKRDEDMSFQTGRRGIDRSLNSVLPGGTLNIGFFGGEPLLTAKTILRLQHYAQDAAARHDIRVRFSLTTNATVTTLAADQLLLDPQIELGISCDGIPAVHNAHRSFVGGYSSHDRCMKMIERLVRADRQFSTIMVVRPDTVRELPGGIEYLLSQGVRWFVPSLDLSARWHESDIARLEESVYQISRIWRIQLPDISISWLDDKWARAGSGIRRECAECRFGNGEVAVAPSGRLYPCERLIGIDAPTNRHQMPGNVYAGDDFLAEYDVPDGDACDGCQLKALCNTDCRCANFFRTGDYGRPDGLLCRWNKACIKAAAELLEPMPA